jgi:hypothetical protein
MCSTIGGDEVGQARGRMGSEGGQVAQPYGQSALYCGGLWGKLGGDATYDLRKRLPT